MSATWADSTPWTTPTVAWTGAAITIADANATSNPTVTGFASSTVTVAGAATSPTTSPGCALSGASRANAEPHRCSPAHCEMMVP